VSHPLTIGAPEDSAMCAGKAHLLERVKVILATSNASLRYQPQIDLQNGRIAGVEAVLCVPGLGGYRPATKIVAGIDLAGLGMALAEFQIREACRVQLAWLQCVDHDCPIGVPVSNWAFENPLFLQLATGILADVGLAPSYLELEIGVTAPGINITLWRAINSVRDAGMPIAIDGFNAANANLRLLAMMPISKLRVATLQLLRSGNARVEKAVFDAILGAARGLGIMVCATGVGSAEILAAVLRQGRPLAQGMELGSMLNGEEFLQCLRDRNETTATLPQLHAHSERFALERDRAGRSAQLA
jgi:EAL domain-containing protein (putative c-di-GMP-specific phosphodiesterase class I)